MPRLTRRRSLAAILGGSVVSFAGLGFLGSNEKGLVQSILQRVVGSYEMEDAQFDAFMSDLETPQGKAARVKFALFRAFSATEPDTLLRFAPAGVGNKYEAYERRVVTSFLTRTDFLTVGAKVPVSFVGEPGCRNPFAKFDMA